MSAPSLGAADAAIPQRLSIVVPAHDEAAVLGATLAALKTATTHAGVEAHEVIVVADACSDDTEAIARQHGATVVEVEHRQIARTRNSGADVATGDALLFVDADTIVPGDTLRAALASLASGVVGGGADIRMTGPLPAWARLALPVVKLGLRVVGVSGGCFLFARRDAFDAIGGFDETLYASEEVALLRALRRRGRVRILREPVLTSGRKTRTHTPREILLPLLREALRGRRALRTRDALDVWYGARRPDPAGAAADDEGGGR